MKSPDKGKLGSATFNESVKAILIWKYFYKVIQHSVLIKYFFFVPNANIIINSYYKTLYFLAIK